ncbi:hypothetical protein Sjap_012613 [Stephania japonica]|uniref:Aldehyde oxidase n=1 Tax=Stephania japonica TaxID=461633 RepID=A0AAP0P0I9_9MAGN
MAETTEEVRNCSTNNLFFAINGDRFELSKVDPSTTLLEFLRTQTPFKGAKLGCGEGGCGACVVLVSKYDSLKDEVEDFTVSSCLTLLCSVNGCSITTTEGLGNSKDGYHPIHKRIAEFHGSQCGFCTPGMCMSLFSAIVNADKTQTNGSSKLTVEEAEKCIAGNLCRCTGYRPIADACKSFAADVDVEDLGLNSWWRKEGKDGVMADGLPSYTKCNDTFPEFLKRELKSKSLLNCRDCNWYTPSSIDELQSILKSMEEGDGARVKLVAGNTGTGYYKEIEGYDKYIDIRHIPELLSIRRDGTGVEFGAAVTISRAIQVLKGKKDGLESSGELVFGKIADHMDKVASQFVRNTATLGGNLVMAQREHFPSDVATVLLTASSSVNVLTSSKILKLTLEEFLETTSCNSNTVLLTIAIPSWNPVKCFSSKNETRLMFETCRAAPRPLGSALAYLNAAFLAQVSIPQAANFVVLETLQLAFGAYGTKHAMRARKIEESLIGKPLNRVLLFEAIKLVGEVVAPEEGTSHPAYRSSLAVGFLFDFLYPLVEVANAIPNGISSGYSNSSEMNHSTASNPVEQRKKANLLLSSKQVVEVNNQYSPVGEPTKKAGAEIQASGEAIYVDDIPSPKDCLYGAFIYSTRPLARIKAIRFKSRSVTRGVVRVITFKDIPEGGKNIGVKTIFGVGPLFADEITRCCGEPIGFVVADTQKNADMAAQCAVVDYGTENLEPPILSVEEAVRRSSFIEIPAILNPRDVGDFTRGMQEADHSILQAEIELRSQYFFYMETQTALAVPDEENTMNVFSANQCPENAQIVVAKCLGVPEHNVRVITRRVGGGFGGKALKALPVAAACALAAYKVGRPVRVYLNRKTDMVMAGGRHPMKIKYDVGFNSDGKIVALHLDILINAGATEDVSKIIPHNLVKSLNKYDWGALSFDIKLCKTNLPSRTAMRGPGEVQGSYIAEAIIENVASFLSIDADYIRKKNIHTYDSLILFYGASSGESNEYTLPLVLNKVVKSSSFHQRVEAIRQFNSDNIWRKRGISCVPVVHEVMARPTPGKVGILNDGSIVAEVGGIDLGQGLWTKVKQMVAFALRPLLPNGSKDLLERIRVVQADTLSLVQGGFTSGSTTSESSCEAVRLCCNALVERLNPLKEHLQDATGPVSWDVLILQANLQSVNLQASTLYIPESSSMRYLNYGAAVSEVEVDLLTGATTILQTDIIYDCGQSLNPAVDMGQIEGAFVQGIGYFMLEEYLENSEGLVMADGTWTYKIPTIDTIPRQFNVEIMNSGHHQKRVLSSKASGEPPLLLAASIHCATRGAIREARKQLFSWIGSNESYWTFELDVPATMPVVKKLCGLDNVERYLQSLLSIQKAVN